MASNKKSTAKSNAVLAPISQTLYDLINTSLYGYQYDYATDLSRLQCSLWCRGAGKTYSAGWKTALRSVTTTGDFLLTSASENQANELMRYAKNALDLIDQIFQIGLGQSVYYKSPSKTTVTLFNGSRIIVCPANPRTLAGYTANVVWDEIAKTLNDYETFRALGQVTRGIHFMDLLSSAWGAQGLLFDIMVENKYPEFIRRNIDIHKAIAQGLPRSIDALKATCDEFTWKQEFLNEFMSSHSSPFPPDLVNTCRTLAIPPAPQPGALSETGALQQYCVGIDVGRTNDKTAIVWATEYPKGFIQVTRGTKLSDMPLPKQEMEIERILELPYVCKLAIDQGGLGRHMAESLGAKYPDKLIPFNFSMQSKNRLVQYGVSKAERMNLRIGEDCATDIYNDLPLIQVEFTHVGNMVYGAKRGASGHADGAWAFLLALEALKESGSGYMMMDFGLDQSVVEMIKTHGSLPINHIMDYVQAKQKDESQIRMERERTERKVIYDFIGRLTNNNSLGIFTEEEISQMADDERDFYGLKPRGTQYGNDFED